MPISYNVIQKTEPGVTGGGDMKWYATTVSNGEVNIHDLIKSIEKISTMSGGDIRGVVYTLVDVIVDSLADGRIVRIGELGDLRVSLSSHGHDSEEEVSPASIRGAKIRFRPGDMLNTMLNNLEYQKA